MSTRAGHPHFCLASSRTSRRPRRTVGATTLVACVLASTGLGTSPAAAASALGSLSAPGPVPGTIFVVNGGGAGGGTGLGSVTLYPPGATGNARPEAVVAKGMDLPGSLALDSSGDLWVANTGGTVVEYSKAELASASPAPTVTISSLVFETPGGLAFDASDNLWVADPGSDTMFEFAKAQLAKSGAPKPAVTLSPNGCSPEFDRSGNLWEGSSGNSLSELAKAQLTKSGFPEPKVTIISNSLSSPCKPAFDRSGNLWVGNYYTVTVVEFTEAELARSGSPAPKVVISSHGMISPGDVAVDSSGNLWVPSAGNNTVLEFTKAQVTKSGSPAPALTVAGPATELNWPWAVAIYP